MKKNITYTCLCLICTITFFGSCKKTDNTPAQTAAVSTTQLFNYSDAWGLLAAVQTVTTEDVPYVGPQTITVGTAVAAFTTSAGGTTYQNAGAVTCNNKALTVQSGNSYVYQPAASDPTGIDLGNGCSWAVAGGGDVPAFNYNFYIFPTTPTITSNSTTVTRADGYTFTISGLATSDSVLYILASGNSFVQKRVDGYTSSVTFSAAELSTLQASKYGLLQVTPYKFRKSTTVVPGKNIYFVNQVTVSKITEFK